MIDAIDELVVRSKDGPKLRAFHSFHRAHPEVLDFLVQEIRLWLSHGRTSFSYQSLWHYARWQLQLESGPTQTYKMNDHTLQFYGRAITILHPEFNGRAEFRPSDADDILGATIAQDCVTGDYARRLIWLDGTSLENGWRPIAPHVPNRAPRRKPSIH